MHTRITRPVTIACVAALAIAILLTGRPPTATSQSETATKASPHLRIGVYDNRAIAVAYAPSKFNPVGDMMKEYREAKAKGDTKRMKELEAWGEAQQARIHFQGFGRAPVDDLLAHVEDRLAEVAAKHDLDAIVWQCNYMAADAEVVDVTDALVALFDPSDKTLQTIADLKEREPLDWETIQRSHDH